MLKSPFQEILPVYLLNIKTFLQIKFVLLRLMYYYVFYVQLYFDLDSSRF